MDFGLQLPLYTHYDELAIDDVVDYARYARDAGMTSFFSIYHLTVSKPLYQTSWLDPLITLGALAARIDNVEVGPLILPAPYEHPIHVAKKYATLDQITDGRVILGLGTGWDEHEFKALGIPKRQRGKRTQECIEIIQRLWNEDNVTYDGDIFSFEDVSIEPKAEIPIWLGGGTTIDFKEAKGETSPVTMERVQRRIARHADGWVPSSLTDSKSLESDYQRIRSYLDEFGRSTHELDVIRQDHIYIFEEDDRQNEYQKAKRKFDMYSNLDFEHVKNYYLIGEEEEIVTKIERRMTATDGADRIIFAPITMDKVQLDLIIDEIMPEFT